MIVHYLEKGKIKRRQTKTYCDSCHVLIGDSGPGKDHVPWGIDNVCPYCNGKIHDPDAPKWSPKLQ